MEKKQFHARTVSRTVRSAGTGNYGAVKQFSGGLMNAVSRGAHEVPQELT
jgi:hypothetical protein